MSLQKALDRLALHMDKVLVPLLLIALLAVAGAAHAAELVTVTRDATTVARCHPLGTVQSVPPYWTWGAALKQVKTQTQAPRGDTVLLTSGKLNGWFTTGVAYRCAQ